MLRIEKEIQDFEKMSFEDTVLVEVKKDFNRRTKLSLLLTKFESMFGYVDSEVFNRIIRI